MAYQADVRRIDEAAERATGRVLSSRWDGLNPVLLATIYPVTVAGLREPGSSCVMAPVPNDGFTLESCANWQSPFEQTGPETKMPSLMAMAQTGTLSSYGEMLIPRESRTEDVMPRLARELTEFSRESQGRTGMTKLNSTQVFTGAPPVKFSVTLLFKAYADPVAEVEEPIDQLMQWHLSRELAPNGSLVSAIQQFKAGQGFIKALLPSQAPQLVALLYGGRVYSPVVIESISWPLAGPRGFSGHMLSASVQLNLATLTALDANDWKRARDGLPTRLFSNS